MFWFRRRGRKGRSWARPSRTEQAYQPPAAFDESAIDFRAIADACFDGIAIVQDGRVLYANRGLLEISGYSSAEVAGRPIVDFVADEFKGSVEKRIACGALGEFEVVGIHRDGRRILLEATTRQQTIAGQPVRVTVFRYITERRRLEERLRQVHTLQTIAELVGGAAHDFNNLLTVIRGHTDILLNTRTDRAVRPHLTEIRDAVDNSVALIRQVFALRCRETPVLQLMCLNDTVRSVFRVVRALVGMEVRIVTRLAEDLGHVRADATQVQQIIMNLAVNARDAMPNGGTLTVDTANVTVGAALAAEHGVSPGTFAVLRLSDTGEGMSADTKRRVFEPFFTTKEATGRTGLGLSTIRRIVEQGGGFVSVDSDPGRGSVFSVYLPLAGGDRCDGR